MPKRAHSSAIVSVSLIRPAFDAQYGPSVFDPREPSTEAMLTIAPRSPALISRCAACCATRKTPLRLVSTTVSQASSGMSARKCSRLTPALLTTTSARQPCWSISLKASSTDCALVTSMDTVSASPPAATIRAWVSSSFPVRRAARMTRAPAPASTSAKPAPRPVPAPVTRAVRPSRLKGAGTSLMVLVLQCDVIAAHPAGQCGKLRGHRPGNRG